VHKIQSVTITRISSIRCLSDSWSSLVGLDESTQISQNPEKVKNDDLQVTLLMLLFGFDPKTCVGWAGGKNEEREGLPFKSPLLRVETERVLVASPMLWNLANHIEVEPSGDSLWCFRPYRIR
jgi:hypothetical protein